MPANSSIGDYLINRLQDLGVRHVFGVPGDYVLSFFKKLSESPLQVINTCDEQGAGFAADAYARLNGLGVVCVTYGVGGLKVANTTAEAFAEMVPVLVISGAPGLQERLKNPMLHHRSNQFDTQKKIFEQITVQRLFQHINAFLDCNMVVISDIGDALFGAIDLVTCQAAEFLSPAYYTSLGFAVPASIAVQISRPDLRPLVLVGDGAFQMTGLELSTAVRYHLNPIVVVLNNGGYATERPMVDGPFNDVLNWNYSRLPELLGNGMGFKVETEQQLEQALATARLNTASYSILDVRLAPDDISPALQRLTQSLGKRT